MKIYFMAGFELKFFCGEVFRAVLLLREVFER